MCVCLLMKRIVVRFFAVVTGLALASGTIDANPCVYPKRVLRGQTVNLQPLMSWWHEPKGVRPLSAWKHVQGTILRDTPSGWVVDMERESDGQAEMFFLKNPPRDRLLRFQQLQQELNDYIKATAVLRELVRGPVYTDWYSYYLTQWTGPAVSLTEYRDAEAALSFIHRRMATITDELASMQNAPGQFKLDAFALKCDELFEGLPVYDYGSTAPFGS